MKKACRSAVNPMGASTVLSVGQIKEDHASLEDILNCSKCDLYPNCEWSLNACPTLASALAALRKGRVAIVLCESDLRPGTWKEVLEEVRSLPDPPFLIVTSRLADERLWAEALNLGAYDVLAKPFYGPEVARVVGLAWLNWKHRHAPAGGAAKALRPAIGM